MLLFWVAIMKEMLRNTALDVTEEREPGSVLSSFMQHLIETSNWSLTDKNTELSCPNPHSS